MLQHTLKTLIKYAVRLQYDLERIISSCSKVFDEGLQESYLDILNLQKVFQNYKVRSYHESPRFFVTEKETFL